MSKLNRTLMEKWIVALRSGEYKQGRGHLHSRWDETYCCLGVLQAIKPDIEQGDAEYIDGDSGLLDEDSLKKFLGVNAQDGFFQKTYAKWNDEGMTFPKIADELETRWLNKEEDKT